jgi:hypothetical protein
MKTYKEVIEKTLEYYKNNPRAYNGHGCEYLMKNGAMCAVGRVMNEEALKKYGDAGVDVYDLFQDSNLSIFDEKNNVINFNDIVELFKEEYQSLDDIRFWQDLQNFHDNCLHWETVESGNNITKQGELEYERLLKKYY